MIQIVPTASSLHSEESTRQNIEYVQRLLEAQNISCKMVLQPEDGDIDIPVVFLVLTGGTEHQIMKLALQQTRPVILLAHPHANSFPASLEILARLHQLDKKGKIVFVNDTLESKNRLKCIASVLESHPKLASARIGVIGKPSDWLIASMPDWKSVCELWKCRLVEIPMEELLLTIQNTKDQEAEHVLQELQSSAAQIVEPSVDDLRMASRVYLGLKSLLRQYNLEACTLRCFDLVTQLRTTGCLALSMLLDEGIIAGCEGDIPSTLTMLWMHILTGRTPFMANPQDVDLSDNTVSLAHCTIARSWLKEYTLRSHFESSSSVGIEGKIEPCAVTMARIGGTHLQELFVSDGEIVPAPHSPHRCRTQTRVRLKENAAYFIQRPLGNHHIVIPGHFANRLQEYHEIYIQ